MPITRKSLADTIDAYDDEIASLQSSKRDTFQAYREQLADLMGKDEVKVEIEAAKAAIKRRRAIREKGEEVVEHKDALVDEIFEEITATRAPRATRVENIDEFDAETGEIIEPHSAPVASLDDVVERATDSPPDGQHDGGEAAHTPTVKASPAEIQAAVDADVEAQELIEIDAVNEAPERVQIGAADPQGSGSAEGNEAEAPAPGAPVSPAGEVAAGKSAGGDVSLAPAAPPKLKMNAEFFQDPHPLCQRPGFCGGNSNIALCEKCKSAAYPVHQSAEAAE